MALTALIKAISMGYLLGAVATSLAALWWKFIRPHLPGHVCANAGFALIVGAMAINTLITLMICLAVVNGAMPMTTNFFHRLMHGGWSAAIAVSGWMLLGMSLIIGWVQWRRGRLPRNLRKQGKTTQQELPAVPGIRARFTHATSSLCLAGVWRPELWINPRVWQMFSTAERELAIKHELCHLARRDNLKRIVLEAIAALYFALPWARHWAMQYELDSELAVDNTCRLHSGQDYCHLIARLSTLQFNAIGSGVVASRLTALAQAERLATLAQPVHHGAVMLALPMVLTGILLSQALALALLSHSISRCLLTCYLGY